MAFELHHLTAQEQWDWVRAGEATSAELVEHHLRRIERLDPALGAFARVDGDRAMDAARAVDAAGGGAQPLRGVPTAEKELATRAGTTRLWTRLPMGPPVAEASDDVVAAIDATGAVSLGATTAPEFGLVGFTEPVGRPPARNPWDLATGAGGSSGGAAAAVAAGLVPFAVGSDGGGSIRIPSSVCGVVGLKPSRGRVPAQGGQESVPALPTAGPIARTVADAAMLLDALVAPGGRRTGAGYATVPPGGDEPFLGAAVRGEGRFQIGVLEGSVWDDALPVAFDREDLAATARARDALDALGHGLEPVRLPGEDYPSWFRVLWQAGAAGIPAHGEAELALLEPYTREMVERGRRVPAERLLGALRAAAAFERRAIRTFAPFDAVLLPTVALGPRPLGWYTEDPSADAVFDRQVLAAPVTSFVNVSGLPAITLPVGAADEGRPAGVQLIGRPGGEAVLLSIGRQLERRFRWDRRHPPAFW